MIKIVVPLATSFFNTDNESYLYPLPLIEVMDKIIIEYVIDNLTTIDGEKQFIFIVKESDCKSYNIHNVISQLVPDAIIIKANGQTKGAVCSILLGMNEINEDDELLIVNSDQIIDINYNDVLDYFRNSNFHAGVIVFESVHPRWSYALIEDNCIIQTAEKNPVSKNAIAGWYYFKKGEYFKEGAFNVIRSNDNFQGNYYTSSVYNQLVLANLNVGFKRIEKPRYHSFYSIQKITEFENYLKNHGKI